MRKTLVICLLLPFALLLAQSASDSIRPYCRNISYSAPVSGGTTYIRAEVDTQASGYTPPIRNLVYSTNNWSSITTRTTTNTDEPNAEVYEGSVTNPSSGTVKYYFHFEDDTMWAGTSPVYDGSATTGLASNLYVSCGYDGAGTDSTLPSHDNAADLDIIEYWFTISNNRFYGKIQNATGHWHLENGSLFFGKDVFGYAIAINNPNRPDPNYLYVMAHCGVLSVSGIADIRPGVLRANMSESNAFYVGDIAYNISGDVLEMSAPISTFTGDANFGGATPAWGFYQVSASTMYLHASLTSQSFQFVEATKIGKYYINNYSSPQPWQYTVGANNPPTLTLPGTSGSIAYITYTDTDNNFPTIANVLINDHLGPYDMFTDDFSYQDGSIFRGNPGYYIGSGTTLYFTFSDGMATVYNTYMTMMTDDGLVQIPEKLDIVANTPNPFNPTTDIKFNISAQGPVTLEILDQNGRLIERILQETMQPGTYVETWDAAAHALPSGVYLARLSQNNKTSMKKMVFIK